MQIIGIIFIALMIIGVFVRLQETKTAKHQSGDVVFPLDHAFSKSSIEYQIPDELKPKCISQSHVIELNRLIDNHSSTKFEVYSSEEGVYYKGSDDWGDLKTFYIVHFKQMGYDRVNNSTALEAIVRAAFIEIYHQILKNNTLIDSYVLTRKASSELERNSVVKSKTKYTRYTLEIKKREIPVVLKKL